MRTRTYYAVVAAVAALNIVVAAQFVSHAPYVDGWAVWNRIMLLDLGQLSLSDYLLGFFGAHPHSVILLLSLLDYRLVDGDQSLLTVTNYLAVTAFSLFCARRFLAWARLNGASGGGVLLGGVAIAALTTTLADWQVMTLPFQAVLSVSRFVYLALLWWLIRSLRDDSRHSPLLVTALACVAVTFHGTGMLFSMVFLLVHLLRYTGIRRCLVGSAPLSIVLLHAYFYKQGGELDSIGSIVSARGALNASKALFAYFGTPLLPFRDTLGDTGLLLVGATVLLFAIWLASACLLDQAKRRARIKTPHPADDARLFAGAVSFLVLLSSAAAAVLATIRGGERAYHLVFEASRYVAYAVLIYVLVVCALARTLGGKPRRMVPARLTVGLLAALGLLPAAAFSSTYRLDVLLDKAVAAISVGISPIAPPAEAIWLKAADDWYWVDALPKTTGFLMKERTGPWSHLPSLGQAYLGRKRTPEIEVLGAAPCKPSCPDGVIEFSGVVSTRTNGFFSRSRTVPIIDAAGKVIGFAAQVKPLAGSRKREFFGYLVATEGKPPGRAFVGPSDDAYDDAAATRPLGYERPHAP